MLGLKACPCIICALICGAAPLLSDIAMAYGDKFTLIRLSTGQQMLHVCLFTGKSSSARVRFGPAGALRLVAEAFPWQAQSSMAYMRDNHNSVVGIRESALQSGASAVAVDMHHKGDGKLSGPP